MKTKKLIDSFKNQKIDFITKITGGGPVYDTHHVGPANSGNCTLYEDCFNSPYHISKELLTYADGNEKNNLC